MKKNIALITNADRHSGVGSRAYQLMRHMGNQSDIEITPVMLDGRNNIVEIGGKEIKHLATWPSLLRSKSISWVRLARHLPKFDMYDISNQTLSFLAKKRHPSLVTVHDIIELTDPQDSQAFLLNKYLMSGIVRADTIIAVSEYTKRSVCEYFHIPESAITVIPNGVDELFSEIPNYTASIAYQELLRDFGMHNKSPILLSVGSEHPRKNMKTILHTLNLLRKQYPSILLLKVGDAGLLSGRRETLDLIDQLGLRNHVKLLGNIPTERLNELYNIADVLLFPSRHEGFGMPPLEAMAAGCPVVCSNATSLPEVVGDAAIMHDSDDAQAYAKSIVHILTNASFQHTLTEKGKKRAATFSWKIAAQKTLALYRN